MLSVLFSGINFAMHIQHIKPETLDKKLPFLAPPPAKLDLIYDFEHYKHLM